MLPPLELGFFPTPLLFSSFSLSLTSGFKRTNGKHNSLTLSGHRFVFFFKEEKKLIREKEITRMPALGKHGCSEI
jgi:hypothetical protein